MNESDDLKVLASLPNEIEATEILAAVKNLGIHAVIAGEFTSGFKAVAPGEVKVLVKQADLERARQAVQEWIHRGDNINWSNVDVGEPDDIETVEGPYSAVFTGAVLSIVVGLLVPLVFQNSNLDNLYLSKGFWGAVIVVAFVSAIVTARKAFILGQQSVTEDSDQEPK